MYFIMVGIIWAKRYVAKSINHMNMYDDKFTIKLGTIPSSSIFVGDMYN